MITDGCYCCNKPAEFSILLAFDDGDEKRRRRFYIPNQHARSFDTGRVHEVWFCARCMRYIEDSMRSAIEYLQMWAEIRR